MCRRFGRLESIALIAVLCAACGDNVSTPASRTHSAAATNAAPPMADAAVQAPFVAATTLEQRVQGGLQRTDSPNASGASPIAPVDAPATPSMVIRDGTALVQVDSLEIAVRSLQQLAITFGGYVGNTSLAAGDNQVRSATIQLKIPAARYDEVLAGMRSIGKVEAVSSTAQDVGEEFVDITARATTARRLEERLIALLATRTGKLEDVLAVERELARVREELERYDGRIRYLKSRVATSTLAVTVHERVPLVSSAPGENVIVEAFKDAWRNFVRLVAAFIASLGVLIPLTAIGVAAWLVRKRFMRAR